jgi:hypothetical protein
VRVSMSEAIESERETESGRTSIGERTSDEETCCARKRECASGVGWAGAGVVQSRAMKRCD